MLLKHLAEGVRDELIRNIIRDGIELPSGTTVNLDIEYSLYGEEGPVTHLQPPERAEIDIVNVMVEVVDEETGEPYEASSLEEMDEPVKSEVEQWLNDNYADLMRDIEGESKYRNDERDYETEQDDGMEY